MLTHRPLTHRQAGFSLVELMIAITLGLVVLVALTTFSMAQMRQHGESALAIRLTQDVRTTHSVIAREVRRAGFHRDALSLVSNPGAYNTNYVDIGFSGNTAIQGTDCPQVVASGAANAATCMVFAYDQVGVADGANTPNGLERRGFRRVLDASGRGVLQAFMSTDPGASPACGDAATDPDWITLTAQGDEVSRFLLVDQTTAPAEITTIPDATMSVRNIIVQIEARPVRHGGMRPSAAGLSRRLCETIRVRADIIDIPPPAPAP